MKRFIVLVFSIISVLAIGVCAEAIVVEVPEFYAVVAGKIQSKETPMLSERESWLLPLRKTCENLGISDENIEWNPNASTAILRDKGKVISVTVGEDHVLVNGERVEIGRTAILHSRKLYLPLDFYESVLRCKVVWDNRNGIVYIQREEIYNEIYSLLKNAVVANVNKDAGLVYEYKIHTKTADAQNGYELNYQGKQGTVEYNFVNGECTNSGIYSRLGRDFEFDFHRKNNYLYKNEFLQTVKTSNKDEIKEFEESILNTAFLSKVNGKIISLPIADEEADKFSGMSELEKLSLVLEIEKGSSYTEISGSLEGIITPFDEQNFVEEYTSYKINNITGKLWQVNQRSITIDNVHEIGVKITVEWLCKYKTV